MGEAAVSLLDLFLAPGVYTQLREGGSLTGFIVINHLSHSSFTI